MQDIERHEEDTEFGLTPGVVDINLAGLDNATGYAIRRAQMWIFRDLKARFRPYDISPAQYSVMQVVSANPGLAQARIAEALSIERARLVLMLDRLEEAGLLVRTRSKSDRRSHALHLTDNGHELLATLSALYGEHERKIDDILGAGRKADLIRLLGPFQ